MGKKFDIVIFKKRITSVDLNRCRKLIDDKKNVALTCK